MSDDAQRPGGGGDVPTLPSILIVDDDERLRTQLSRAFTRRGYAVQVAEGVAAAVALAEEESPEIAVVDLRMGDGNGLELLQKLVTIDPATRVVMLTGYGSIATAVEAMRLGAVNYVPKPADVNDILAALEKAEQPPMTETGDYEAPSLERAEWEHIQRVLADCGGNITHAAERLRIHRRTLQRKLERFAPQR